MKMVPGIYALQYPPLHHHPAFHDITIIIVIIVIIIIARPSLICIYALNSNKYLKLRHPQRIPLL
jgi:hypothetical protein